MNLKKQYFFYIISFLCIAYGVGTAMFTLTAAGSMVIILLGGLLFLHTFCNKQIQNLRKTPFGSRFYRFFILCISIFGLTFCVHTIHITQKAMTTPKENADVILVLGAGLIGEDVSLSLGSRLDTAVLYHKENPNSIFLVSGGQGENEIVTEAYAMSNYLQKYHGISPDDILLEENSARTTENFTYSKMILDAFFPDDCDVVFVTNDFHVYRSGLLAELSGLDAEGLSAPSPWYLLPNYYIREYFAIIKYHLVDDPFWN